MKNLLLLFVFAGLAAAQPKLAEFASLVFTDVTPSMVGDFESQMTALRDAYKKAGLPFRLGYTPIFGGGNTYLSITPVSDLSSWDSGPPVRKMMGEAAYQKWLPQYRKTFSNASRVLVRTIPNLTIQDAAVGSMPILVVQRTRVDFSRRAEFEARSRDVVIPALKKAGVKRYVVSRVMFGGASNEYITTRLHSGLVDADKANQVIAGLPIPAGLVRSSERTVYRINPNTSFAQGVEIR